jgi:hypothetical protein
MSFIEILPKIIRHRGEYVGDKIRISLPYITNADEEKLQKINVVIGKDKCRELGFIKGQRVTIAVSNDNPYIWQLIKHPKGRVLSEHGTNLYFRTPVNDLLKLVPQAAKVIKNWGNEVKFVKLEYREGVATLIIPTPRNIKDEEEESTA